MIKYLEINKNVGDCYKEKSIKLSWMTWRKPEWINMLADGKIQ